MSALLLAVVTAEARAQTDQIRELVRQRVEALRDTRTLDIDGAAVGAYRLIPDLYERRSFDRAWHEAERIDALIRQIRDSEKEGLDPEDYHLETLLRLREETRSRSEPARLVDFDILLTDGLVRLAYHLRFGKVDPASLHASWNLSRDLGGQDPAAVIQAAIDAESLQAHLETMIPRQAFYARFKQALARYRAIRDAGGWPAVPAGATLKPGMRDPRIVALRERLRVTGDLEDDWSDQPDSYDDTLEQAVLRFQRRHGLEADAAVGKKTIEALNVGVAERIDQIRVNLERARWVFQDIQGDFLVVNVAGFRAYLVRGDEVVWSARVMVGKPYRKTPVFKSAIKYLVFNPSWTVPPGILRKDVLPKARRDPGYIRDKHFEVIDRDGRRIDPDRLDWASFAGRFPYQLRQPPGPTNALGRIKFVFPNPHLVFLHDTPNQALFAHPERTFSSGCIRVERPLELAELLLGDPGTWNRDTMTRIIDRNVTKTVFLPEPFTVMLLYWTAMVDPDGTVSFRKDAYDRDRKVLAALNGDFVMSLPEGLPGWYYEL